MSKYKILIEDRSQSVSDYDTGRTLAVSTIELADYGDPEGELGAVVVVAVGVISAWSSGMATAAASLGGAAAKRRREASAPEADAPWDPGNDVPQMDEPGELDTKEHDPGPEVDDEGGMSERRSFVHVLDEPLPRPSLVDTDESGPS